MSDTLKVALTQMTSVDDVAKNFSQIIHILDQLSTTVDIVSFPENCLYMRIKEGEQIPFFKLSDPIFYELGLEAKKRSCVLHLGSVPVELDEGKFNCSVLIDSEGKSTATYQKIHLFDIQLNEQKPIRESDVFHYGSQPSILKLNDWKMGQSICYDLRFSELYRCYALREVDLIFVPSAFLVTTGQAHWETLLRARAIESQAYVIASAQSGMHQSVKTASFRETYGHAMAIDPWGQVLTRLDTSPSVQILTLNKQRIAEVRQQIPMKDHRRL
ncbi:MAG: carbon-nitrogen hydrolase family protein [Bdellovibrionota bacterium]